MDNLDDALRRLASAPTHPRLNGLELRVLAHVREAGGSSRVRDLSLTAFTAVLMGTASVWVSSPASAASPLDAVTSLSPANLLAGAR